MGLMMRYGIRSIAFAARWIVPNMQIDASDLGKVCVAIATSEKAWDVRRKGGFVPNEGLRELLKSL
jgi:hypothetical protein